MLSDDNPSTRERSIRAALDVVRAEGVQELTTRAIARRSGLTQPAIYRYFRGKDDLVREILGEIRALFYARLETALTGGDSSARLIAALDAFRDFAVDEPRLYEALFLQTADGTLLPPPVGPSQGGNIFGFLVDRVSECASDGFVRSEGPVAVALSLAAHAQGLVLLYRQGRFGSKDRFGAFYRRSMDDLLRGMVSG